MAKGDIMTEPTLFTYLDQISNKTLTYEYSKKLAPAYMLSLWLSHDQQLINIVQAMNHLQFNLPDDVIYKYYVSKVPAKKKRYIKWTKKSTLDKEDDKIVTALRESFNISKNEAKMTMRHVRRISK